MILMVQIVLDIGGGHTSMVHAERVRGHQLHDLLAKETDEKLRDS